MQRTWGQLAADLQLSPDMGRIGRPRPRQAFAGQYRGCRLTLLFDTQSGGVRAVVSSTRDHVLSGEDDLRILPRAGLGGWPGGPLTGDADFDAAVALLTGKPDQLLLRLDAPTRSLLAEMIELGAWITDDQVLVEPRATGAMQTTAEARQLIDSAIDLVRALRQSTPEQLIDMAFGDPSEAQRERAWRQVQRMSGEGRKWAEPLLDAIDRHRPPEGPALLARIPPGPYDFDRWLALCDAYADEIGPTLPAGWSAARDLERAGEIIGRIAQRLVDGRPAPEPSQLVTDSTLVRGLVVALADQPAVLWAMLGWPLLDDALRVEILAALVRHDGERAVRRLLALDLSTPTAEVSRIHALDALPAAYEAHLLGLRPRSRQALRALFTCLRKRPGAASDLALLDWVLRSPDVVGAVDGRIFHDVAGRIAEELGHAPDGPLTTRGHAGLPPALADALTRALIERKPRHGAGWLARHAPDNRTVDPEKEAALLAVLGELADPAGEPRCLAALAGSDFLRIAAARALAALGTARALAPLDDLTGFFAPSEVKAAARAAIEAIRERETRGPRGGLTVSGGIDGGGLSIEE